MSKRNYKTTKQARTAGDASQHGNNRVYPQNGSSSGNMNGANPQNTNGTGGSEPQATYSYSMDRWLRQDAREEPYHNVGSFGHYVPRPQRHYRPETSDNGTTVADQLSGRASGQDEQSRNNGNSQ